MLFTGGGHQLAAARRGFGCNVPPSVAGYAIKRVTHHATTHNPRQGCLRHAAVPPAAHPKRQDKQLIEAQASALNNKISNRLGVLGCAVAAFVTQSQTIAPIFRTLKPPVSNSAEPSMHFLFSPRRIDVDEASRTRRPDPSLSRAQLAAAIPWFPLSLLCPAQAMRHCPAWLELPE